MKVEDLMTRDVITVAPDAPLKDAARRMLEAGVSGLPVTDEEGSVVGIITEADFVQAEAGRRSGKRAGLLRFIDRDHTGIPSQELRVRDVMTGDVEMIGSGSDHAEAARRMEQKKVKRLPVVDEGRLVGMISRSDILRAFARHDKDIITEIEEHVLLEVLWIDPDRVSVTCVDGHVTLDGTLETKSEKGLLLELTKRLDGVVSVEDCLGWEIDNTKLEVVGPLRDIGRRRTW